LRRVSGNPLTYCIEEGRKEKPKKGFLPGSTEERLQKDCSDRYPGYDIPFYYPDPPDTNPQRGAPTAGYYHAKPFKRDGKTYIPFGNTVQADRGAWKSGVAGKPPSGGPMWNIPWGGQYWKDVRQQALNSVFIEKVMAVYPWPSPATYTPRFYTQVALRDLQELSKTPTQLTEEAVRDFITITLLDKFDTVITLLKNFLKEKEENAKKKKIIKTIAMVGFSVFVGALAPLALSSIVSVARTTMTVVQKKQAVKGMIKAAKQFEKTDKLFSLEIDRVAKKIEAQAAAEEAARQPTEEEIQAIVQSLLEEKEKKEAAEAAIKAGEALPAGASNIPASQVNEGDLQVKPVDTKVLTFEPQDEEEVDFLIPGLVIGGVAVLTGLVVYLVLRK
jgi:hypothetical protein